MEINVKQIVSDWKSQLARCVKPGMKLTVFQVGNNFASNAYIRGKKKDCEELNIEFELVQYDDSFDEMALYGKIVKTQNPLIVQLPVPKKINLTLIKQILDPRLDVDGFSPFSPHLPCTPGGILHLLRELDFQFKGKKATILGHSEIVGKPMARLLLEQDMTTTICHSKTPFIDVAYACKNADLIVSATGVPNIIDNLLIEKLKKQILVDVGINRIDGKLCGDANPEIYKFSNLSYTPVPGGVGLLTRAQLMENVINAYDFKI